MSNVQAQPAVFIAARYEITGPPIGRGGMGVVYKAYDKITRRHVALKTIWGTVNSTALELFEKEWGVLARLSHPNIVDILETGQFDDHGSQKPYFVMPLLPGVTLEALIKNASQRLTVDRIVDIILQACRGLQAAHDQGLIHRDVKPSNIFVLEDDSVKIIDFGVVHFADMTTMTGLKGSLHYLAPELLEGRPPSALSDLFSLGVVCYEAFTRRKPFDCSTEDETFRAIRTYIPPPVSEINNAVNELISRTVHKVMAKQPWHRFSTAREFGEVLKKAQHNQLIECFDQSKIQPRIERIKKAQSEGDFQFAKEILSELEAEGHMDPQISMLRVQLDEAIKHKTIRQLMESARTRIEEEEFPLALQKIQEVLEIDPGYVDAIHLKAQIEQQRNEKQVDNWYRLVHQHIDNQVFSQARLGLEEILRIRPADTKAHSLLAQVDRQEKASIKIREEKEQLYQSALKCYECGEISTALDKLERLLSLARQTSKIPNPEKEAQYQHLYNQIRSERETFRNAYAEARRCLEDRNFVRALALCAEFLKKNPADPMFQALKLEVEERERQERSAAVADVNRRIESEADLDRKITILKEAVDAYPAEPHFQETLKLIRGRRDLVNSIVNKSRQYEHNGQFNEALSQLDILRNIYPQYPGLDAETQRLRLKREEQIREEAKSRWVRQIDQHLETGDYEKAQLTVQEAFAEFPKDRELASLEKLATQGIDRRREAERHFCEARNFYASGAIAEGLESLRKAVELDNHNHEMRTALFDALLDCSRVLLNEDWRKAQLLAGEALQLDPAHPAARNLFAQVQDRERQEMIDACVYEARELQSTGDVQGALTKVREGLGKYPHEARLSQLEQTLSNSLKDRAQEWRREASVVVPPEQAKGIFAAASGEAAAPVMQPIPQDPALKPEKPNTIEEPHQKKTLYRLRVKFPHLSGKQWAGIIAIPILLFAVLVAKHLTKPRLIAVELHANVPGAKFTIDGQPSDLTRVTLLSGQEHVLEASQTGYQTTVRKLKFSIFSSSRRIEFDLTPLLPQLQFTSELPQATLFIDEKPAPPMQPSGVSLTTGAPSITVLSQARQLLRLSAKVEPAQAIKITSPVASDDCSVVIISVLGPHAKLYATPDLQGSMGQSALQAIPADGLEFDVSGAGTQFNLSNGRALTIQPSNAPLLQIDLFSLSQAAKVEIQTNAQNAKVKIDGQVQKELTQNHDFVALAAGQHKIQLTADGFAPSEERMINVAVGQTLKQDFKLRPLPQFAHLTIQTDPSAELFIDGERQTIPSSGILRVDLSAETHKIILQKPGYEDAVLPVNLKAGEKRSLTGKDLLLVRLGTAIFRISPVNAEVTFESDGHQIHAHSQEVMPLRAGTYTAHAEAPGYVATDKEFSIVAGQPRDVILTLSPVPEKITPSGASKAPMGPFEDASQWSQEGNWWLFKHDSYGWLRSNHGMFDVIIEKRKGGSGKPRKIQWTIDYRDDRNKAIYWIEGGKIFHRQLFQNGRRASGEVKFAVSSQERDVYHFKFEISTDRIVVSDNSGTTLDEFNRLDPSMALGKIGFHGEIAITVDAK